MKDLIIVGAGGYAREIYELIIKPINKIKPVYNVLGCIDDDLDALKEKGSSLKILGKIDDWKVTGNEVYVMGIAKPQIKERISQFMKDKGAVFENIISPTVVICDGAKYGEGLVAYPGAVLGPDVNLGNFVTVLGTGLGHDAEIGDYSTISSYCGINGYVKLACRVFVGSHAVIAPNVKIGEDAYIGTGAVVVSNVKNGIKVFGNPAHKLDF